MPSYGGLDGGCTWCRCGKGEAWSFATAFGAAITAPVAVARRSDLFGCEDGYLYV